MILSAARKQSSRLPLRRRAMWRSALLLILLLHLPATAKVYAMALAGEPSWSSVLLISATNLFFVLEIVFARSLHLLTDRRSVIAFLVIVALLHVGVIDRGFPDLAIAHDLNIWLAATAGGVAALRWLSPVLLACIRAAAVLFAEQRRQLARLLYRRRRGPMPALCAPDRHWLSAPLRAPPCPSM